MQSLVSVQDYFFWYNGIRTFLDYYFSKKKEFLFLERKNILAPYQIDGRIIDDLETFFQFSAIKEIHLQSVLDASIFHGPFAVAQKQRIKTFYYTHSFLEDELAFASSSSPITPSFLNKYKAQQQLFQSCDRCLFFTSYHLRRALRKIPSLANRSQVLSFPFSFRKRIYQRERIILYVGRFSKEKGILEFIAALDEIKNHCAPFTLVLIGDVTHSSLTPLIKEKAKHLHYELIDWIADKSKLFTYYQKALVVVVPSYYETFSWVVKEALENDAFLIVRNIPVFQELYSFSKKVSFFSSYAELKQVLLYFLSKSVL